MNIINVAKDFTRYPSGRYEKYGTTSGEAFRKRFLLPRISKDETLTIQLDGTIGYGSSFLEEAFGGLIRETGKSSEEIMRLLSLETENGALRDEIIEYIKSAESNARK